MRVREGGRTGGLAAVEKGHAKNGRVTEGKKKDRAWIKEIEGQPEGGKKGSRTWMKGRAA